MRRHSPTLVPIAIAALAALAALGCSEDLTPRTCTPGREVACTCGGGGMGRQICRADGAGYGACNCDDGGVTPLLDGGSDGGRDIGTAIPDTPSTVPDAPDAWTEPDTGPPPPRCSWVWLDRGGPAFQPHACRPGAGVVDGMLVDPQAFFEELRAGRDPDTWPIVMDEIEAELWSCGVGQQRGSGGDVRGRLFLPTAACPDSSPPAGDTMAMFLGVRQEPDCWMHPSDVVECP